MNEIRERMLQKELDATVDRDFAQAVREWQAAGWAPTRYVSVSPDRKGIKHTGEAKFFLAKNGEVKDRTYFYEYVTPRDRAQLPYWNLRNRSGD